MDVKKEEMPNFFVLHPMTDQLVPYPHSLEDHKNVSPELVLLWARRTVLYLETEQFEAEIKDLEEKKAADAGAFTEEQESRLKQVKEILPAAEEEKKVVIEKHAEMEKLIAEKNEFSEAVDKL
jgi:hypothetical protein